MTYRAPVADMLFTMTHVAGLETAIKDGTLADLDMASVTSILEEAGKVAADVLAPLNRDGDRHGVTLADGVVTTTPGWPQMYRTWADGGWAGVTGDPEHGGMGLPILVNAACVEMWNAANMSFALCPLLSVGAVEALHAHGSEALKTTYLEKLVTGAWTGTMNLTEPQAGSDLSTVRTKAVPHGDGTYRIAGQKIYITYGEHDMVDNIIHLVLARLAGAPEGTRGISLFLVPKFLVNDDGTLGARNDVRCSGIEHKLGIHASPTCTMTFGDAGGAVGWLIGEENRGLNCMFTMMNNARLNVGLQGVAIADRATQQAIAFAAERRQGRGSRTNGAAMIPIIELPDVRRMLMTMKALTSAARCICYMTAAALDLARSAPTPEARRAAGERAALLTPIAKAFSTDIGNEVASLGVQVHGGMGFVEETGAAQHMRDARILPIYEGTNGIQAIDLVQRKLPLSGGATVAREIADMEAAVERLRAANIDTFGATARRLGAALDALKRATAFMTTALGSDVDAALAGATPYLRLFALARGGTAFADGALSSHRTAEGHDPAQASRITLARFFAENLATAAPGLADAVVEGGGFVAEAEVALAG